MSRRRRNIPIVEEIENGIELETFDIKKQTVEQEVQELQYKKVAFTYKKEELERLQKDLDHVIYLNNHEIIKIDYVINKLQEEIKET